MVIPERSDLPTSFGVARTVDVGRGKADGIAFGTRAADNLIALRAHDGRNAPITFTTPPAPGVLRPTPPREPPPMIG